MYVCLGVFLLQTLCNDLFINSMFVSAGLAYKPWLKVLLAGLV